MTARPFDPSQEVNEEQRNKTLQELEGQDWGEPNFPSHLSLPPCDYLPCAPTKTAPRFCGRGSPDHDRAKYQSELSDASGH